MNFWKKLISSLLSTFSTVLLATPQQLDKVIAIVNDSVVLQSNVDNMLDMIKIQGINTGEQFLNNNALRNQILEHLIIDKIILQIAKKMQIQIPDQAIDVTIANIAAQNGLTINQLQQRLSTNGINLEYYRSNIKREMLITEIRNNEINQRIIMLPQEIDSLADHLNSQMNQDANFNLSYILIPLFKNSTHEQNKLAIDIANEILAKLKQNIDFSKLIITYSAKHNNFQWGQMGWKKVKELPTIFAQQIQHARKGDIIGPIRSNIGFYIFKINDIQSNKMPILVTEVKASHILIKLSPIISNEQAYAKIQEISNQIKTGQITFAEAAKKYSQDPVSALRGGELGWNIPHVYDPAVRDALMHLGKGEISQPIHSYFGWHLIKLEDTRKVDKTDIAQKDHAYSLIFNRKFNEEVQIWIQELRASAYVKILNDIKKVQ